VVSLNTGFHVEATDLDGQIRLSVTVVPANTRIPATRFRDIPKEDLTKGLEQTRLALESAITDMWNEIISNETLGLAFHAVGKFVPLAELD